MENDNVFWEIWIPSREDIPRKRFGILFGGTPEEALWNYLNAYPKGIPIHGPAFPLIDFQVHVKDLISGIVHEFASGGALTLTYHPRLSRKFTE